MKRLLSWLLVLTMLVACLPMSVIPALAVETGVDTSEGSDLELPFDELLPTEPEFGTAENPLELVEGENNFTVIPGTIFHATYPNTDKTYIMTVTGTDLFFAKQYNQNNGNGDAENKVELTLNNDYAAAMGFGLTFESTAEAESVDLVVTLTEKVVAPGADASNPIAVSVSKAAALNATANIETVGASVYYAVTFVDAGYVKFEATNGRFGIGYDSGETLTVVVKAGQTETLVVGNAEWKTEAVSFTATYLTDAEIADIAAAEAVTAQINALTTVDDDWNTILAEGVDAAQVAEARAAYEALSDGAKALVEDYIVNKLWKAEELTIVKFAWAGMSVSLEASLLANFVMNITTIEGNDNYAVISKEVYDPSTGEITIESITVPQSDWGKYGARLAIPYTGVAAKMMMDEFTVIVYNAKGQQISEEYTRNIEDYLYTTLRNSKTADTHKVVCVDFLNYGSAAQDKFNYRSTELANAKLTDAEKALATADDAISGITSERVQGSCLAGTAVAAEFEIIPAFVYTTSKIADVAYANISYTNNKGVEIDYDITADKFTDYSKTMKQIQITGTAIADGASPITVTLCKADGTVVDTSIDCVSWYAVRSKNSHEVFVQLLKLIHSAGVAFG